MEIWEERLSKASGLSREERELFVQFATAMKRKRKPAGPKRIIKYLADLNTCRKLTGKGWNHIVRDFDEFSDAIEKINSSRYKFETKKDYKRILGQFYHYCTTKEPGLAYAPKKLKDMVAHDAKPSDKRLAKETISREELRVLVRYAESKMDAALLMLLYESGMRIGEFQQLRRSDIKSIDEGLEVRVPPGKTGERQVVVVESKKYVHDWLDSMPDKRKDAPLWNFQGKPLGGPAIAKRIRTITLKMNLDRKRQGIPVFSTPINPHNFRHSRATELGGEPGMTEQILCRYMGWEIGSDMPRTYLHLTDEQVKKAVLRTYGRAKKEEDQKIQTHWVCLRCSKESPLAANYCMTCGASKEGNQETSKMAQMENELEEMKARMAQLEKVALQEKIKTALSRKSRPH